MRPVMPANVIDEPSVLWRSVGLQLFLNHKNLLVDSDGEKEETVSGTRGPALCRLGYINERWTPLGQRQMQLSRSHLFMKNYERTVESWIFITVYAQHSFLIHILLEMKCSGCGWRREGRGTALDRNPEILPLSLPSNPLAVPRS